jgi:hypothetical protein
LDGEACNDRGCRLDSLPGPTLVDKFRLLLYSLPPLIGIWRSSSDIEEFPVCISALADNRNYLLQ